MNSQILRLRSQNLGYPLTPIIGSYYDYINVNNDEYLRKNMINYFREKTKKWLISDLDVSNCFTTSGKTVKKIKCNKASQSHSEKEIIAKYIYDNYVYPNRLIKKILFKYTRISGTNWYDLKINKDTIKRLINHVIKKQIKK